MASSLQTGEEARRNVEMENLAEPNLKKEAMPSRDENSSKQSDCHSVRTAKNSVRTVQTNVRERQRASEQFRAVSEQFRLVQNS